MYYDVVIRCVKRVSCNEAFCTTVVRKMITILLSLLTSKRTVNYMQLLLTPFGMKMKLNCEL